MRIGSVQQARNVGRVINDDSATEKYLKHLLSSVETPLKGLKIVVDCANGASSFVAPEVYRRAGAEVIAIFNQPDGWNINDDCGSTHLHQLSVQRFLKKVQILESLTMEMLIVA